MCGFSWQLQLHPLQPPSAHMVRFEQGALTQPALGLAGAAMRGHGFFSCPLAARAGSTTILRSSLGAAMSWRFPRWASPASIPLPFLCDISPGLGSFP